MEIKFGDNIVKFEVQYNARRKKLAISVDCMGLITVKAPKNTSQDIIENAIEQNMDWIISKQGEMSSRQQPFKVFEEKEELECLYLGKTYRVKELLENTEVQDKEIKSQLKKFYISNCKKIIGKRLKLYQTELKVKPKVVEIMESKTKWGTCSSDKKLTFNYRLVMAPIKVIDYVVVHELCHLNHMNHDRSFWRKVGGIMPDYKEQQEFLARYGQFMDIDKMSLPKKNGYTKK